MGAALLTTSSVGFSQDPPKKGKKGEDSSKPSGKSLPGKAGDLKKYDDVITKEFKTQSGVFAVHRKDDKVYFEIPQDKLGRLFLWQAEVAKGPGGNSWGGSALGKAVLKFERRGNKIYLWKVGFSKRSDGKAITSAVEAAATDSIIASYRSNAKARTAPPSSMFRMSSSTVSRISRSRGPRAVPVPASTRPAPTWRASRPSRLNIEARALLTFRGGSGGGSNIPGLPPGISLGGGSRSVTALVHQSLAMLPEVPMMGRCSIPASATSPNSSPTTPPEDVGREPASTSPAIRLEKKDPKADVSEPVKPIVFYLVEGNPREVAAVPQEGRRGLAAGIREGRVQERDHLQGRPEPNGRPGLGSGRRPLFRHPLGGRTGRQRDGAARARPALGRDHLVAHHLLARRREADPDVVLRAVLRPSMTAARKLPLPDELTGELLRYVAAHEVGHTLGLRHNHRASQAYSISQLRDPEFTAKNGSVASIMSYGRFNYVAQPEDKVESSI